MSGRASEAPFLVPERKARIDEVVAGRTRTLTVVLEAFCDPQNVNAVLRTCEAFGVQELHAIEGPMKPYDRNKKISQNADKWLDVHRWRSTAECLGHLRDQGHAPFTGGGFLGDADLERHGGPGSNGSRTMPRIEPRPRMGSVATTRSRAVCAWGAHTSAPLPGRSVALPWTGGESARGTCTRGGAGTKCRPISA